MKRIVAVLLVLALLVVAGVGVAAVILQVQRDDSDPAEQPASQADEPDGGGTAAPAGSDEGARTPPDPALAPFYDQRLSWRDCDRHECATLTVPLDYADPAGETIELALLRVPAESDRIGSLVVNPGGPGAPGTEYAAAAAQVFGDRILRSYDVVGFDPRGTGGSAPVDCLTDAELDQFLAADPVPDDEAEQAALVDWSERLGEGCVARSGALARHVSTVEAARDMDVLRAALGEGDLDYFGASYGTKLGSTYADLFPDRVGRFVLDGALDPGMSSRELSLGQAEGFERALRAYVEDCLSDDDCFLGATVEEGLDRITGLMAEIDADPLPTNTDREVTVGTAFYGLVTPLYSRQSWFALTTALKEAFGGSGTTLLALADLYASRGEDGYTDNSAEAIYAINCLDDPFAVAPDQVDGELDDFRAASPTFGDVFAWGLTACAGAQVQAAEPPPEIDAPGAPPIVVIGTTRDPATPYEWAVALAEELESGVLVSRDGDGHTGYHSGNQCVDDAVESFLLDGTVPDDGLSC